VLLCLTANHRNASFDLLEKLSFGAQSAARHLVDGDTSAATRSIRGAVVLATCNRFEAYLEVTSADGSAMDDAIDSVIEAMSSSSGVDPRALRDSVSALSGDAVVEHLFAVSSGLESVVIGEDEISGQVRRALERARAVGTTSSGLEQLFQRASSTSRAVKSTTAVGTAGKSLVRLALDLAASRITDWAQTRVLMVGTGSYAGASLAALRERGVLDVTVFSPSGRAAKFAFGHGTAVTTDLAGSIAVSDVILTCTTTIEPVITDDLVSDGARRLVIDLGLPRNVAPSVAELPGVELLDLETISLHAPLAELNATTDARSLVGAAAAEFAAATAESSTTPAVIALRRHMFDLLDAEIARARARGDSSERTEGALRHLTSVLLHTPSVRARELARSGAGQDFVDGLAAVFGVVAEPTSVPVTDILADLAERAETA
jgi:glutamyl-tRNA reductase